MAYSAADMAGLVNRFGDAKVARPVMSAFGPKQTWPSALHMSAFGGKADIELFAANARNHARRKDVRAMVAELQLGAVQSLLCKFT